MISVVVPVHNVEDYVAYTVASLLGQSSPAAEVLFIDDGSTDGSRRRVERLLSGQRGTSARLLTQPNAGVSQARNRGIDESSGEYVLFLDGDDYVHLGLMAALECAVGTDADIICWGFEKVRPPRSLADIPHHEVDATRHRVLEGDEILSELLLGPLAVAIGSAAYSRRLLETHGIRFTPGRTFGEDREFIIRAFGCATKVVVLEPILAYWVDRGESATNTYDLSRFQAIEAHASAFTFLEEQPGSSMQDVAAAHRGRVIRGHYFHNLNRCVVLKTSHRSNILHEIEAAYPGLNGRILQDLRSNPPARFSQKLFMRSWTLYWVHALVTARVIRPELGHRSAILASVGAVTCGDAVAWCFV